MHETSRDAFREEMVTHLRAFSPWGYGASDGHLAAAVERGLARAETYGLMYRGPLRLFLELTCLLGIGFDEDPQIAWASETLRRPDFSHPMIRAGRLEVLANAYLEQVHGPGAQRLWEAISRLEALLDQGRQPWVDSPSPGGALSGFGSIFPEKLAHIGLPAAQEILRRTAATSGELDATVTNVLAVLRLTFGVACEEDPHHPWIAAMMRDLRSRGPKASITDLMHEGARWLRAARATRSQDPTLER